MGVITERYIRKPLHVDAVRVKAENFDDIVRWCQGEVQTSEAPGTGTTKKYIKVRVHNPKNVRQTQAFIGDWILYTDRGYKVYTNKAFRAAFNLVEGVEPKVQEMPPAQPGEDLDSPLSEDEEIEVAAEEEQRATAEEIREKLPHAQDRRPQVGETFSTSDTPIEEVRPGADLGATPQGEEIEVVEATPQAIADAVKEQQPVYPEETTIGGTSREDINVGEPPPVDSPEESTPLVPPHTPITPVEPVAEGDQPDPVEEFEATPVSDAPPTTPPEVAPQPEPVSEQPPEVAAEGKMVISLAEQRQLGPDGVRELLSSGEAVLEQDLAESA